MAQGVASAPALQQDIASRAGRRTKARSPRREPHRHTYGAIDLGTNNCRLLIARPTDGGFTVIDAFSRIVRLGEGLSRSGELSRGRDGPRGRRAVGLRRQTAAPQRLAVPLGRDRGLPPRRSTAAISSSGCATRPASCSTSSSPQEEARLAVLGCHKLLEPGDGPALIFDIGGGSTELVLIDQDERHAADQRLVERAVGRGLADRERRPRGARGPGPARRLQAHARARAPRLRAASPTMLPERARGHPPARHQRHGDDAGQRPPRACRAYDRRAVDGLHVPVEAMRKISAMIAEHGL